MVRGRNCSRIRGRIQNKLLMKLLQIPSQIQTAAAKTTAVLSAKLSELTRVILRKFDAWSDFFIADQEVTLSEFGLILLAGSRSIWAAIWFFGLGCTACERSIELWISVFGALATTHVMALFVHSIHFRAVIGALHAFVWAVLMIYALLVNPSSPTVAVSFSFTIFASFVSSKLFIKAMGIKHQESKA